MSSRSKLIAAAGVALLLLAAGAQAQAPATLAKAPAGKVLSQIPAGSMGFVVVGNVQGLADKVDAFLKAISPAEQPLVPGKVLEMLTQSAGLREGFNAAGGFAVVMLDPQQFDIDVLEMVGLKDRPADAAAKPKPPVPVVMMIPGKDPAKLLATHQPQAKEGHVEVKLGGETNYALQKGEHVLLSPSLKAVRAMAAAKTTALSDLSVSDSKFIATQDAAVWINFKVVGPIVDAALVKLEKEAKGIQEQLDKGGADMNIRGPEDVFKLAIGQAAGTYREILKQLRAVGMGVKFAQSGVLISANAGYLPNSVMGKALAAYKHVPAPLLNRLPNMPYIFALGAKNEPKTPDAWAKKMIDQMFTQEPFKKLSPEAKAKWRDLMLAMEKDVTAVQMYLGGITTGDGQVGMAAVLECKSAQDLCGKLAGVVDVATEAIKTAKDENLRKLTVKYNKGVETVGSQAVDVVVIDHPDLAGMDESAAKHMQAILGDTKIRIFVAPANKTTVAVTFGGGKAFLESVMKTATGTGTLHKDTAIVKALGNLPKKRMMVGVFNLGNVLTVVKNCMAAVGEEAPAIAIPSAMPFAGSASIEGTDIRLVGYFPSETISAAVNAFMSMMAQMMGGMGGPGPMPPPGP